MNKLKHANGNNPLTEQEKLKIQQAKIDKLSPKQKQNICLF